jgi:N-methylhydantoinase A
MVRAIRAVTVERGLDPRELTLFAFGGSGPVHACDLARTLGIARVLFPPAPGVFTAMGMLAGQVEHHELRSAQAPLAALDPAAVEALRAEMRRAAVAALTAQGYDPATVSFADAIDLRLEGQDAALSIDCERFDPQALRPAFLAAYRETYGYTPSDTIESVALRLHAHAGTAPPLDFTRLVAPSAPAGSDIGRRPVWFGRDRPVDTKVMRRELITEPLAGPLIIEGDDTTIVIPPGASVAPNLTGSLVATLEPAP